MPDRFLVNKYRPTPVMARECGMDSILKDNRVAIDWVCKSRADRLAPYREAIHEADFIVAEWGQT